MLTKESNGSYPESINAAKGVLFELGDKLVAAKGNWNVLIADDTSGRLPARFIRRILHRSGVEIPTFYVVGSQAYRVNNSGAPYQDYFASIERSLGESLHPLLVTESVGTGQTTNFLKDTMRPYSGSEPQIASLVANPKYDSSIDFIGSYDPDINQIVARVFENRIPPSLGRQAMTKVLRLLPASAKTAIRQAAPLMAKPPSASNQIAGVRVDINSPLPVAVRMETADPHLRARAAAEIDKLVEEYVSSRDLVSYKR